MKDWRQFDAGRDWSTATPAERIARATEMTVEVFKKAGLYHEDRLNRTKVRRITMQQKREESEAFDRLISERLFGKQG